MKINKNDPQLTAYVLNELSAQQMKAIDLQIQNDPELKAEVIRLKSNTTQLKNLKLNETFRLDPHQRENIFKAAGIAQTSMWVKFLKYSGGLVAASLAVVIYTNNSTDLKNSASSKMSGINAAPVMSELAEDSSAKVAARAESGPESSKKILQTENEHMAAVEHSRGAPAPAEEASEMPADAAADAPSASIADAPKAPMPVAAKTDLAEAKLVQNLEQSKDLKSAFTAGEVGAADMSPNKMRLLEPEQARKKEAASGAATTSALLDSSEQEGLAASARSSGQANFGKPAQNTLTTAGAGGSGLGSAATANPQPNVSKQLYDLESKSSQPEIYAKIADPIFKCFDSSLSQYVKYDLAWNLTWKAKFGNITSFNSEIIDSGTESLKTPRQDFSNELICVEQAVRTAFKTSLPKSQNETTFKYRFILKSK